MTQVTYEDSSASGQGKVRVETPGKPYRSSDPSPLDGPDEYVTRLDNRGRQMYFKNGKLIKVNDIPGGVMIHDIDADKRRKAETVANDTAQTVKMAMDSLELSNKECLWQDGLGDFMRFVNGRMVYLCLDHYTNMNLGKIAHQLQERADEHQRNTAENSSSETPAI